MPKRPEKYRNATELGEENRCLKHEMDMNTKSFCSRDTSFACNREREKEWAQPFVQIVGVFLE